MSNCLLLLFLLGVFSLLQPLAYKLPPPLQPLLVQYAKHVRDELFNCRGRDHVLDLGPAVGAHLMLFFPVFNTVLAECVATIDNGGHHEHLHADGAL